MPSCGRVAARAGLLDGPGELHLEVVTERVPAPEAGLTPADGAGRVGGREGDVAERLGDDPDGQHVLLADLEDVPARTPVELDVGHADAGDDRDVAVGADAGELARAEEVELDDALGDRAAHDCRAANREVEPGLADVEAEERLVSRPGLTGRGVGGDAGGAGDEQGRLAATTDAEVGVLEVAGRRDEAVQLEDERGGLGRLLHDHGHRLGLLLLHDDGLRGCRLGKCQAGVSENCQTEECLDSHVYPPVEPCGNGVYRQGGGLSASVCKLLACDGCHRKLRRVMTPDGSRSLDPGQFFAQNLTIAPAGARSCPAPSRVRRALR